MLCLCSINGYIFAIAKVRQALGLESQRCWRQPASFAMSFPPSRLNADDSVGNERRVNPKIVQFELPFSLLRPTICYGGRAVFTTCFASAHRPNLLKNIVQSWSTSLLVRLHSYVGLLWQCRLTVPVEWRIYYAFRGCIFEFVWTNYSFFYPNGHWHPAA